MQPNFGLEFYRHRVSKIGEKQILLRHMNYPNSRFLIRNISFLLIHPLKYNLIKTGFAIHCLIEDPFTL